MTVLAFAIPAQVTAQSGRDREAAALAAVSAFRDLRREGRAVMLSPLDTLLDIDPTLWKEKGLPLVERDTTASAYFRIRLADVVGDSARVTVDGEFRHRNLSRSHLEMREFRLVRDGAGWKVAEQKLLLIT